MPRVFHLAQTAFLLGLVLSFSACLGGGGGGGDLSAVAIRGGVRPFTSWVDVAPNVPNEIPGSGQESTYTYDVAAEKVTSLGGFSDVPVTATVSYDSDQEPKALAIETSQSSVSWNRLQGDTLGNLGAAGFPKIDAAISNDETEGALIANPFSSDWNYQTFGVWVTGSGTGSGRIGTFSVGSITPSAGVPNAGEATYKGDLSGFYVAPDGADFLATADLQVDADFLSNDLEFQSSNTQLTRDLQTFTPNNDLNLNGTLTCCGGSSGFSGPLASQSGSLVGEANGSFYGPNAEELGGNFLLTNGGGGIETYVGSFGAAQ